MNQTIDGYNVKLVSRNCRAIPPARYWIGGFLARPRRCWRRIRRGGSDLRQIEAWSRPLRRRRGVRDGSGLAGVWCLGDRDVCAVGRASWVWRSGSIRALILLGYCDCTLLRGVRSCSNDLLHHSPSGRGVDRPRGRDDRHIGADHRLLTECVRAWSERQITDQAGQHGHPSGRTRSMVEKSGVGASEARGGDRFDCGRIDSIERTRVRKHLMIEIAVHLRLSTLKFDNFYIPLKRVGGTQILTVVHKSHTNLPCLKVPVIVADSEQAIAGAKGKWRKNNLPLRP